MQISFDPLAQQEAAAVRAMLDALAAQHVGTKPTITGTPHVGKTLDTSDAGLVLQRAAPLDPAPSTAAADLFATAPAAQPATSATTVPAPPVPSVPTPPAPLALAPTASHASADSTGLPWDERIHAGTRALNADGTWRARRGLNDPELVKRVEAELRALASIPSPGGVQVGGPLELEPLPTAENAVAQAAPTPVESASSATAPAAPIATAPVTGTATPTSAAVAPQVQSDIPLPPASTTSAPPTAPIPTPPAPPASIAAAETAPVTFSAVMGRLTKAISERRITSDAVDEMVAEYGIGKGQMGQMFGKPDVVQQFSAKLALMGI